MAFTNTCQNVGNLSYGNAHAKSEFLHLGVALETPAYDKSKPEEHLGERTIVKLNLKRMLIDRVWRTRQDFFMCLHIDVQVLV